MLEPLSRLNKKYELDRSVNQQINWLMNETNTCIRKQIK
jgi:hypothetical protein